MRGLVAIAILLLGGCVTGPGSVGSLPLGDAAAFEVEVQPVLEAGCANPSCHGNADRPLEVYARFQYRLDPDRLYLDEPITADELTHNRRSAAGFLVGFAAAARSPLLTKPLAHDAGGAHHAGGVVFGDAQEPGYRALKAWADGALEEAD
ncbi:MAG: hypothetical protein GY898_25365 [Proteobacteria bacterium]|nr:hypothetical protein [Pseudomonadota bacterium]